MRALRILVPFLMLLIAVQSGIRAQSTIGVGDALLVNPDFELGMDGWNIAFAGDGKHVAIETDEVYSGVRSVMTASSVLNSTIGVYQDLVLPIGETYAVSAAVRTDIEEILDGISPGITVKIRLQFYDERNEPMLPSKEFFLPAEAHDGEWHVIGGEFTVPAGTQRVRLELLLLRSAGRVWWDAVTLEQLEAPTLAVYDLEASVLSSGVVRLDWNIDRRLLERSLSFQVYRSLLPAFSIANASLLGITDEPFFIDRSTAAGRTYYYRVVPLDADGQMGEVSPVVSATVTTTTPVATSPIDFTAEWDYEQGIVSVSWRLHDESRVQSIVLERSTVGPDPADWESIAILPPWISGYIDADWDHPPEERVLYRMTLTAPDAEHYASSVAQLGGVIPLSPVKLPAGEHPRLFISAEEINALRQEAESNPAIRNILHSTIVRPTLILPVRYAGEVVIPPKATSYDQDGPHHNLIADAVRAALGYSFTDNVDLAAVTRKILLAYAEVYPTLPLYLAYDGRLTTETREEAEWLIRAAWAYDLTLPSGVYSSEDREAIETRLLWNAVEVIDRYRRTRTGHTWQARHNAGIGAVAFLLSNQEWIDEVLYGPRGFTALFPALLRADGLSYMQSITHHNSSNIAWLYLSEAAYRSGYDLYGFTSNGRSLKDMFDAALYHAFSNGEHPIVGHASPGASLGFDWRYAIAYKRYGDPAYAWLWRHAPHHASPLLPEVFYLADLMAAPEMERLTIGFETFGKMGINIAGSTWFQDTGMVILRSSGLQEDWPEIALLYKPHGTEVGHQAADNLTIMMSAAGHQWLPGTGSYRYAWDPPEHSSWYKQSVARSGVVVDERSQYPQDLSLERFAVDSGGRTSSGQLLHFAVLPSLGLVNAETDKVYDGVRLERLLILSGPYVIDRYSVKSDTEHQYDWVLHVDGDEGDISVALDSHEGSLGSRAGYQHIVNVRRGISDDVWTATWHHRVSGKGSTLRLHMLNGDGTEVIRGVGFGPNLTSRPLIIARRQEKETEFVALVEVYRDVPYVEKILPIIQDDLKGVFIKREEGEDLLLWSTTPGKQAGFSVSGDNAFVGEIAFFRGPGPNMPQAVLLVAGTMISSPGLHIETNAPADLVAEVERDGSTAVVSHWGHGARQLRLQLEGAAGAEFSLYRLVAGDRLDEVPVRAIDTPGLRQQRSGDTVTLEWTAEPETVYIVSAQPLSAEWLDRFAVDVKI